MIMRANNLRSSVFQCCDCGLVWNSCCSIWEISLSNYHTPDGLVPVLVDVALAHLLLRLLSLPGTVESWAPSLCQGRQLPDSWRSPAPQTSSIIFRNPEAVRIAMDSHPLPCWSYLMTQNFNGCKRHFPRPSPRVYGFLFKLIREFQVPNT